MKNKLIIYQTFPRLFGNNNCQKIKNGSCQENGCGKFNAYTNEALQAIKNLGITHIWYTGIIRHATQTDYSVHGIKPNHPAIVKGKAGSPYAITDYYDVDPDLAEEVNDRMHEFEALIKRNQQIGIKVIIDFVPNHLAREYHSDKKPKTILDFGENDKKDMFFSPENNFYYLPDEKFQPSFDIQDYEEFPAKATGNNQFTAFPSINDWYETVKLNYGINFFDNTTCHFNPMPDTWLKMKEILSFWAKKGVDGFRCDMVEMVPVEFWEWVIPQIKVNFPSVIFIAELYNPSLYRDYIYKGQFDYLYDKEHMYDTLRAIITNQAPAKNITYCWQAVDDIQPHMLRFLENHDEQRISSDFFAGNAEKAIPAMIACATLSTSPLMIYFGQELGESGMDEEGFSGRDGRTSIFDYWQVSSIEKWINNNTFDESELSISQKQLRSFYKKLFHLCLNEKAIYEGTMYDLMWANEQNTDFNPEKQFVFFRKKDKDLLLIVVNFDEKESVIKIIIPIHAIDFLQIIPNSLYKGIDLLSDVVTPSNFILSSDKKMTLTLPPYSGKVLKLTPEI